MEKERWGKKESCFLVIILFFQTFYRISKNFSKKCLNFARILEQTISQNVLQSIRIFFFTLLVDEVAEG